MMTAGPMLNVELPYNHLYPQSDFRGNNNKEQSLRNKKSLDTDMAYRFVSSAESEEEPMEIVRSHGRFSSSEDEKNAVNDFNSMKRKVLNGNFPHSLQHHPAARGQFQIDPFNLQDVCKLSTMQQKGIHSPNSTEYNGTSPVLKQRSDQVRLPSAEAPRAPSANASNQNCSFMDDDDDSWKICGVCNDKATGYHFNALTCEGCKGFFRRSVKNGKAFTCSYNNQCSITKSNRRQCQACRLRKCIEIGMKRECIMSEVQIQQKKSLVLNNRIKRAAQQWVPTDINEEQIILLDIIRCAFKESNAAPDPKDIRGKDAIAQITPSPPNSPASSNSSTSHFIDLIKQMSQEIAARTPSNMTNNITNAAHVLHFTDIMEFSIKEVIKFCKKIPTFMDVDLKDQIALLKAGCTEILFLKANYTYDIARKALTLGPDILYTRESFLQGGMSEEYTDYYLKFHEDLGLLQLDDTEMSSLSAIALFSADRSDVVDQTRIEIQQQVLAFALQAYTDSTYKIRNRFANIMAFLPRLRTLNALCTHAFQEVQKTYGKEIKPLVMEVQPDEEEC